nr:hypothetical protein [Tanacetum cinerariifolium]
MELYMQNREHERMILESVENGPLIWPTIEENGVTRTKKYAELSAAEKIQADCDMKATNIILFTVLVFSPEDDTIACLNKAMAFLKAIASSRGNNLSGQAKGVKCYNYQGKGHMARQCSWPKRPRNAAWYKEKAMFAEALEAGQILDEEQLAFLADPGVPDDHDFEQLPAVDFTDNEIHSDSNIIPYSQYFQETQQANVQDTHLQIKELDNILFKVGQSAQTMHMFTKPQAFYDNIHKQALGYQNLFHLKKAQRIKPTLYDGIVMFDKHVAMPMIDDEETLILDEESRSRILTKDFGKRFTPQQELVAEQAFWLRMFDPLSEPSDALPIKIEAPKELPKISLVNESLKNLKFYLAKFNSVVKIRTTPNALTEGMFKIDLEPIAPKLLQNTEAHIDYLKYTQELADILRGTVEQYKTKQPLDNALDFACKHGQRIQELLIYVRDTCPNTINLSAKKVVVTPKNKVKKVRFVEPLTSSSNIKQVESSITSDSNTHVLSPTRLKCSTSNCESNPTGIKKNDRILQTTSRNMKNKVEAQPRNVNKKNRVVEPIHNVDVKQL